MSLASLYIASCPTAGHRAKIRRPFHRSSPSQCSARSSPPAQRWTRCSRSASKSAQVEHAVPTRRVREKRGSTGTGMVSWGGSRCWSLTTAAASAGVRGAQQAFFELNCRSPQYGPRNGASLLFSSAMPPVALLPAHAPFFFLLTGSLGPQHALGPSARASFELQLLSGEPSRSCAPQV